MYQVGRANDPDLDDPTFEDFAAAMARARKEGVGMRVMAVWEWDDATWASVICLVYEGEVYERKG